MAKIKKVVEFVLEDLGDGWVSAECPDLPGCISQGRNVEEALANIREARQAWFWAEDQKQKLIYK